MEDHERKTRLVGSPASQRCSNTLHKQNSANFSSSDITAHSSTAKRIVWLENSTWVEEKPISIFKQRDWNADWRRRCIGSTGGRIVREPRCHYANDIFDHETAQQKQINQWLSSIRLHRQCKMRDDKHVKDSNYQKWSFQFFPESIYRGTPSGIYSMPQCTPTKPERMLRDCNILRHRWKEMQPKSSAIWQLEMQITREPEAHFKQGMPSLGWLLEATSELSWKIQSWRVEQPKKCEIFLKHFENKCKH